MGYENSTQLFAAFLHHILPQELKAHLTVCVDDLLIAGTESSIVELTRQAITYLGKYDIRFSAKKMQFKQTEIEYLGCKVVPGGIEPLPRHIEAITALPPPQTIKDLRSMIGMANFIRNWISDITTLLKVMYDTIKEYNIKKEKREDPNVKSIN